MPINEDEITLMIYFSNKRMANLIMKNAPKNTENPLKKHHVVYCYRCHHIGCLANYIGSPCIYTTGRSYFSTSCYATRNETLKTGHQGWH